MIPAWNTRVGEFFKNIWWMTAREMGPVGRHRNIINQWKYKQWSSYGICHIKKRSSLKLLSLFLLFPNQKFVRWVPWGLFRCYLSISAKSVKEVMKYCFYTYHFSFLATQTTAHFFIWHVFNSLSWVQKLLAGFLKIERITARLLMTTLAFFSGWFLFYGVPGGEPCF